MASYQIASREKWGPVWKTSLLFKQAVFVTGSKLLDEAFREEARKKTSAFFPSHHKKMFGPNSLLVQSGPFHAQLRRTIQQSLTPQAVSEYEQLIVAEMDAFLVSCKGRDGAFALVPELRARMVKVALRVLFGQAASEEQVAKLVEDVTTWSKGLLSAPLIFVPWSTAARAMRARTRVVAMLGEWIARCRNGAAGQRSLLARLVNSVDEETGEALSDDAIVDNVFTLIFAGSDTTASSIASVFLQLSLSPELQQQLRDLCHDSGHEEQASAIEAFMGEVLRASPPAPFSMRMVDGEPLRIGDFDVPSGWLVAYGFAGTLGGDAQEYPRPETFDVQRFRSKDAAKQWAFGGGPRMCPGRFLATAEMRTLMQKVLGPGGFRWRLENGQDLSQQYTPGYFPVGGLRIKLQKA